MLWTKPVWAEPTTLGQRHLQLSSGYVSSIKKGDFISLPSTKFSIKYTSELTAIVRRSCFQRKTLHSLICEMQIPAYREHSRFKIKKISKHRSSGSSMTCTGQDEHSIIIHRLIIISTFLRNAVKTSPWWLQDLPATKVKSHRKSKTVCLLTPAPALSYQSLTQQVKIS